MIENLFEIEKYDMSYTMDFTKTFEECLDSIESNIEELINYKYDDPKDIYKDKWGLARKAQQLFLETGAISNILLNYKICIENGLIINPINYIGYENKRLNEELNYIDDSIQFLFEKSCNLVKDIYNLEDNVLSDLKEFRETIPKELNEFIYTSKSDKFTWMGLNPKNIESLSNQLKSEQIDLVIGSAHGAIIPATSLSNKLESNLYFVRYSRFKRDDPAPIISKQDIDFFNMYKDKTVLVLDEDCASGNTLKNLSTELRKYLPNLITASVIRLQGSRFIPDYVGLEYWA